MPQNEEFMSEMDDDFIDPDAIDQKVNTEGEEEDDVELEVVDDTPPEDRGRKPLKHDALAVDDEAEQFNEKFKKRIGELRHQAHDERRAREAAQRERDEAMRMAQETYRRMKTLEQQLTYGQASYAKTYSEKANAMLAAAKEKHRKAYESGDSDAMAEASAEIAQAANEVQQAKHWEAEAERNANSALQHQDDEVDFTQSRQEHFQQQAAAPEPDPQAVEWTKKNKWFGKDPAMTSLAYGVHEYLVSSGVDPVRDADEYYATIDQEMRRRFPEFEWDSEDSGTRPTKNTTKKPASVVAPVARTASGKPNKMVLTKSQLRVAESLGLTPVQYARELQKLQKGE